MFEQLKNDFLAAVDAKDYQKANLLLQDLLPYLSESDQEKIKALLVKAINDLADQYPDALNTQGAATDEPPADLSPQNRSSSGQGQGGGGMNSSDVSEIIDSSGSAFSDIAGGIAALIDAGRKPQPNGDTNVTNNTTNNTTKQEGKKTPNTLLYIGGGIGLIALVFILLMLASKKPKQP